MPVKKPATKLKPASPPRAGNILLDGERAPGSAFRLPPKMAKAVEFCQQNSESGATFPVLSRRFGAHAPTTLLLLGFLEVGDDQQLRYAEASQGWMTAHNGYRKASDAARTRQADDLRAEREKQVLKLCQRPRDYDTVTRLCGDVSTLQLIEDELLAWVSRQGEKREPWQTAEGRLKTTDMGMDSLTSRKQ